jgi:hypothetical protein
MLGEVVLIRISVTLRNPQFNPRNKNEQLPRKGELHLVGC